MITVGRYDGSIDPVDFETVEEANAWADTQTQNDPDGVARGEYFIHVTDGADLDSINLNFKR